MRQKHWSGASCTCPDLDPNCNQACALIENHPRPSAGWRTASNWATPAKAETILMILLFCLTTVQISGNSYQISIKLLFKLLQLSCVLLFVNLSCSCSLSSAGAPVCSQVTLSSKPSSALNGVRSVWSAPRTGKNLTSSLEFGRFLSKWDEWNKSNCGGFRMSHPNASLSCIQILNLRQLRPCGFQRNSCPPPTATYTP